MELANAAMARRPRPCFTLGVAKAHPGRKDPLLDIATEDLSRLAVIGIASGVSPICGA